MKNSEILINICYSIVFIYVHISLYDPHFRLFDGKALWYNSSVTTLVSVAFFLSMVANHFLGISMSDLES